MTLLQLVPLVEASSMEEASPLCPDSCSVHISLDVQQKQHPRQVEWGQSDSSSACREQRHCCCLGSGSLLWNYGGLVVSLSWILPLTKILVIITQGRLLPMCFLLPVSHAKFIYVVLDFSLLFFYEVWLRDQSSLKISAKSSIDFKWGLRMNISWYSLL